jgi:predicted nucleic acid-binding protein
VLVDTSVWVDHFRRGNRALTEMLEDARVWTPPFVIGELACGLLSRREEILALLTSLPSAPLLAHHRCNLVAGNGSRRRVQPGRQLRHSGEFRGPGYFFCLS